MALVFGLPFHVFLHVHMLLLLHGPVLLTSPLLLPPLWMLLFEAGVAAVLVAVRVDIVVIEVLVEASVAVWCS